MTTDGHCQMNDTLWKCRAVRLSGCCTPIDLQPNKAYWRGESWTYVKVDVERLVMAVDEKLAIPTAIGVKQKDSF